MQNAEIPKNDRNSPALNRKIIDFGRLVFVSVSDLCNRQKSAKRKNPKKCQNSPLLLYEESSIFIASISCQSRTRFLFRMESDPFGRVHALGARRVFLHIFLHKNPQADSGKESHEPLQRVRRSRVSVFNPPHTAFTQ